MKFSMERAIKHFNDNGTGTEAIILSFGFVLSILIILNLMVSFVTMTMKIPIEVILRTIFLNILLCTPLLKALWKTREK